MEKLSQKENILLGYTLQRSFTNPTSSPGTPSRNSDIDFHDVFGGPPRRRSSIQETRYSFTETLDSFAVKGDNEALACCSSPWSSLNEKPVFGEESVKGRRHPSNDFYDDIFKGDESITSPRKHDRDLFSSVPGSRVLSPARPLPPSSEPFGSSSLPAQLSLPTRLTKGTDLPPFGSTTSSPYNHKDSASNGTHTNSPRLTLSRFSSLSSQGQEDLKNDYNSSYHTGLLSPEFHLSSKEASSFRRSDNTSSRNDLTKGLDCLEDPTSGSRFPFHFSIYKWASKGVPLMMPLRGGNWLRSKERSILRRSSSAKERIMKEKNEKQSPTSTIHNIDFPPLFHETANNNVFRAEGSDEGNDLLLDIGIEDQRNPCPSIEETISATPPENESSQSTLKDVGYDTTKHQTTENLKSRSLLKNVLNEKAEKKMTPLTKDAQKHEAKTLSSLLLDNNGKEGEEEIPEKYNMGKMRVKSNKKSSIASHLSSSSKKQDKETSLRNSKVEKANFLSSDMDSGHNIGRKKVGGKVTEFIKIFNQEPVSKPQDLVDSENPSSGRKKKDSLKAQTEATVDKINMDEKPKLNSNLHASIKVDDISKQPVDDHSAIKTASNISSPTSSKLDSLASYTVSIPDGLKFTVPDIEEPFEENFLIKELPQDYGDLRETDNVLEEFKAIDAKIRQWSNGKEGNIRSLLSTLQYVLWPGSGWRPVPLVDIIQGNAVKRSYQKALLYLHPDKLQQKGASSNQKYIAAKVFDILQEAWTHFNTIGAL